MALSYMDIPPSYADQNIVPQGFHKWVMVGEDKTDEVSMKVQDLLLSNQLEAAVMLYREHLNQLTRFGSYTHPGNNTVH